MRQIGKLMQMAGLVILPLAMFMELGGNLGREFHVSQMVFMMVFGAGIFYLGRLVEGYAR